MGRDGRRPAPPGRRRYPPSAYLPFAIMVAVPIILLVVLLWLISRLLSPHTPSSPPVPTPRPTATVPALVPLPTHTPPASQHPAIRHTPPAVTQTGGRATATTSGGRSSARATATAPGGGIVPRATATTPVIAATNPVTVALGATSAGAPVGAATLFHGSHTKLWAFAVVPNVHAGDTVRFIWRNLDRNAVVENYPEPVQVNAARFPVRMYAYIGAAPTHPFPPAHYRVDVYRNATLVTSGAFQVVP